MQREWYSGKEEVILFCKISTVLLLKNETFYKIKQYSVVISFSVSILLKNKGLYYERRILKNIGGM